MLYSLKTIVILHPYLPMAASSPQWPLSPLPRWLLWRGSTIVNWIASCQKGFPALFLSLKFCTAPLGFAVSTVKGNIKV